MRVRPAVAADAEAIGAVHVAAWRSAYAGILPGHYLAGLSVTRHSAQARALIARGHGVLVAEAGEDGGDRARRVVGFATVGRARRSGLGDGEIETLYVLDDWRDQGLGRALLRAGATALAEGGCASVYLWVLDDNQARWFYQRMGGRAVQRDTTRVAGKAFGQTAYVWDPVTLLTNEALPGGNAG